MTSNGHASNGNGTPSPAAAASAAGGSALAMSTASVQASTAVGDPYQQAGSSSTEAETAQQHAPAAATSRPAMYDRRDRPLSRATLDQSFFCVEPHDEFTREVGDWIWGWIHNRQNVEIEAKIGLLVDNRPGLPPNSRVTFPLGTETILTDASFCKFVSNMTLRQHHHFNQILNLQVGEASQPHWQGAPIRYTHTKEIDAFYPAPPGPGQGQGGNRTRIRVTKDEKDRDKPTAKACVEKTRVADMNIFSPKRGFDFRISISVETPVPLPRTKATHERWKNRVSYQHQAFQVDLTQVKAADSKETLHELEVEFSDMPLLMQEGYQKDTEEGSLYYDLVQVFLNNIRMLIRNAAPP